MVKFVANRIFAIFCRNFPPPNAFTDSSIKGFPITELLLPYFLLNVVNVALLN